MTCSILFCTIAIPTAGIKYVQRSPGKKNTESNKASESMTSNERSSIGAMFNVQCIDYGNEGLFALRNAAQQDTALLMPVCANKTKTQTKRLRREREETNDDVLVSSINHVARQEMDRSC
ncbi:hypothetical protein F5Y09DRAFT_197100 [Xylaria sp. FL1042]|nr:hypothetical protein F5Y09DRAFT_197100 [Xylaria sp. FL1042]